MASRPQIVRSYSLNVIKELPSQDEKNTKIEVLGQTQMGNPIFALEITHDKTKPYILITGGVHGDEPVGPYYLLNRLNRFQSNANFNYIILPCINPDGYERNTRNNKKGIDLNRDFRKNEAQSHEASVVMNYLSNLNIEFELAIDLHETGESESIGDDPGPTNFYMWEINPNKESRLGAKIIDDLYKRKIPTCNWETIFGDTNNNGIINYPEDCGSAEYASAKSLDVFCKTFSKRSMTTETSVHDTIEYRINTMDAVFDSIFHSLSIYDKVSKKG